MSRLCEFCGGGIAKKALSVAAYRQRRYCSVGCSASGRKAPKKAKRTTAGVRQMSQGKRVLAKIKALGSPPDGYDDAKPKTRGECGTARPCPWVSCRYHMYMDVLPKHGSIKMNFAELEPEDLKESCALDIADKGGVTLDEAATAMNITRERVRQIEAKVLIEIRRRAGFRKGAEKGNDLSDWRDSARNRGNDE